MNNRIMKAFCQDYVPPVQILDFPIDFSQIEKEANDKKEKVIMEAVCKIGVDVDKDALVAALRNDRERYLAAYNKGWDACNMRSHGTWIDIWDANDNWTSHEARCSCCSRISERPLGEYCKWCGAEMDADEIKEEEE